MRTDKPATAWRWIIGLGLALALGLWVHLAVGWPRLLAPWAEMPAGSLAAALALVALSYLLRAVRVYDYFHERLRGRFAATARLSFLHNFANNLLPMRLGEMVFPLLMRRYFGLDLLAGGVSLVWIRLLDLHFVLLIALLALALSRPLAGTVLLVGWLLLLPLGYLLIAPLSRRLAAREGRIPALLVQALGYVPRQPRVYARIWLWTALSWSVKVLGFALVVMQFVDLPVELALLGIVGAELSSVLPVHGVAGAGSYEGAMALALLPFGVPQASVLIAAVNLHLFLLGATLLLGGVGWLLPRPAAVNGAESRR